MTFKRVAAISKDGWPWASIVKNDGGDRFFVYVTGLKESKQFVTLRDSMNFVFDLLYAGESDSSDLIPKRPD